MDRIENVKNWFGVPVKSIFVSDVHLLTKRSKADELFYVLRNLKAEQAFVLGDLIDLRDASKYGLHITPGMSNVLYQLFFWEEYQQVVYISGNHERYLPRTAKQKKNKARMHKSEAFGLLKSIFAFLQNPITIQKKYIYESVSGLKIFLTHGDGFGSGSGAWKTKFGGWTYPYVSKADRLLKRLTKRKFSLIRWLLNQETFRKYRLTFIERAFACAHANGCNAIMCGHMHDPYIHYDVMDEMYYFNTGDWVDNCTLILETMAGEFVLVKYYEEKESAT